MNLFGSNRVFFQFVIHFLFRYNFFAIIIWGREGTWTILIKVYIQCKRIYVSGYYQQLFQLESHVTFNSAQAFAKPNKMFLITFKTSLIISIHCLTKRNKTKQNTQWRKNTTTSSSKKNTKKLSLFHSSLSFAASFGTSITSLFFVCSYSLTKTAKQNI